jgi:hypothetical protein
VADAVIETAKHIWGLSCTPQMQLGLSAEQLEAQHIFPYNTRTDLEVSAIMKTLHDRTYAAASVTWHAGSGCPGVLRPAFAPGASCEGI